MDRYGPGWKAPWRKDAEIGVCQAHPKPVVEERDPVTELMVRNVVEDAPPYRVVASTLINGMCRGCWERNRQAHELDAPRTVDAKPAERPRPQGSPERTPKPLPQGEAMSLFELEPEPPTEGEADAMLADTRIAQRRKGWV